MQGAKPWDGHKPGTNLRRPVLSRSKKGCGEGDVWDIVSSPVERALSLLDFITCGDFRHFAEQPNHRAIAGGGKLDGTRYRLGIDVGASHPVEDFEARVDPRMLICPVPLDFHAEAMHLLAFFAQDRQDIHGCTASYRQ